MTTNNEHFMKLADEAEEKMVKMISQVANLRMECLANEFRLTFPKHSLKIIFGNGDEFVSIDGRDFHVYDDRSFTFEGSVIVPPIACLEFIAQAVYDVCQITDGYRRGCPDDLEVLPDDSELQGGPDVENEIITIQKSVGSDIRYDEIGPTYRCPRSGPPVDSVHI